MSSTSNIEWTDATWNPIVGCSIVSPGCTNCYAMKMAARIEKMSEALYDAGKSTPPAHYNGTTKIVNGNAVWTGKVALAPDRILTAPLRWKKPRRIFVNSMGDLFHESIPDEWIDRAFAVMALSPQHQFQVLTKRAERMRDYLSHIDGEFHADPDDLNRRFGEHCVEFTGSPCASGWFEDKVDWPLDNVWLGVSAERQQEADERIPHLLMTPAAIRFVSCEPLLGAIDLRGVVPSALAIPVKIDALSSTHHAALDWVIVGGESGAGARPMHPDWPRSLRDQCQAAGVPFFFKQWGEYGRVADQRPMPDHLPQDADVLTRVGKKAAGRLLDGREHNEFPQVT